MSTVGPSARNRKSLTRVLGEGLVILATLLVLVGVIVVRYSIQDYGHPGMITAMVAGGLCFVGTGIGMYLSKPTGDKSRDTRCLLLSIVARTGVPLLSVVALSIITGMPFTAVFGMVLAYYLVALSVETWFAVRLVRHPSP